MLCLRPTQINVPMQRNFVEHFLLHCKYHSNDNGIFVGIFVTPFSRYLTSCDIQIMQQMTS